MEEALASLLRDDEAIAALIGDRLTWSIRQQGAALPCLVLTVISRVPEYSDDGEDGLDQTRVQFDCYANEWAQAKALARAVRARISGMKETSGSTRFDHATIEREDDTLEEGTGPQRPYRTSMDFTILHSI